LGGGAAIVQAAAPVNPVVPLTHTFYGPDGTPLGYRAPEAAERLVANGYAKPVYVRKRHLKAISSRARMGAARLRSIPGMALDTASFRSSTAVAVAGIFADWTGETMTAYA